MSSTKSSKGDKRVTVEQRDGQFVVRDGELRKPERIPFPANRTLRQGEIPKR